jgi:hypothetical protein
MKSIKHIIIVFAAICVISCGSDDDSAILLPAFTGDNATGIYDIVAFSSAELRTEVRQGGTINTLTETVGSTFTDTSLTLTANGNYSLAGTYVEDKTIAITGNFPSTSRTIITLDDMGTYETSSLGTSIILTDADGEMQNYAVTLFDGVNLLLNRNEVIGDTTFTSEIRLVKN